LLVSALALLASCKGGTDASADANTAFIDGSVGSPALIRQVLATERVVDQGAMRVLEGQLAYGQHSAQFFADDDGLVENAINVGAQEIRVIFSQPLRANRLEEIACADGTFSRLPDDTTSAEIADCIGSPNQLVNCTKACLSPGTGSPVGVLDLDANGVPDDFRMIDYNLDPDVVELGASVLCDGVPVPLDPDFSFWSSAGSQQFPSDPTVGFRGLGPVLVLKPEYLSGMRSGASCRIELREEVVDNNGQMPCAPDSGVPADGCVPGDTSAIVFNTEPLMAMASAPRDGETDVALSASAFIVLQFNANLDPSAMGIQLSAGANPVAIAPQVNQDDATIVIIELAQDFLPSTTYTLTIGSGLKDILGGEALAKTITWTTASS
jgi:hypothetical protein